MMGQEHIRNIALLQGARVSVVYDPDANLAALAAKLAGGAVVAQSFEAFLGHPTLDAIVIVSPNHLHVAQLKAIAATRPMPVLCEKPLYTNPADAPGLAEFERSYPAPIWVAMEYRYMPPIAAMIEKVGETTGGVRMLTIREHRFPFLPKVGNWNRFNAQTGGTMVEKCCHFFDLMRLILKDEPVRVMASAGQAVNHLDENYDGRVPDVWDNGYVIVDFAGGARAMLELCMFAEGSRWQEELSAVGPNGKIEAFVPGPKRFWNNGAGAPPVPQLVLSPRRPKGPILVDVPVPETLLEAGDHNGATFYQHERFLESIRGQRTPEVTLSDGAKAVALGLAAQVAAAEGRVVAL